MRRASHTTPAHLHLNGIGGKKMFTFTIGDNDDKQTWNN